MFIDLSTMYEPGAPLSRHGIEHALTEIWRPLSGKTLDYMRAQTPFLLSTAFTHGVNEEKGTQTITVDVSCPTQAEVVAHASRGVYMLGYSAGLRIRRQGEQQFGTGLSTVILELAAFDAGVTLIGIAASCADPAFDAEEFINSRHVWSRYTIGRA